MKPVAVLRFISIEGPGWLTTVLDDLGCPMRLIAVDEGAPIPASPAEFSALILLGGPMSVNDDLPWIPRVLDLVRAADAAGLPTLGHCLGSQLQARALGAHVHPNADREIGWFEVTPTPAAERWFGQQAFPAFHWHGETWTLPPGADLLLSSEVCCNQAFRLRHNLGFQCHLEITEAMIPQWCDRYASELAEHADAESVQSRATMIAESTALPRLRRATRDIYADWLAGHL